ncbi:uncharacterized protein LOC116845139 isoform X2 [Odontomachus brunneus]|nr:uncharacterized protein LOC116845139 isoform X2 [Odontomachus brunneus]XP_032673390.1 uncharacterized protein LOC116845139 isoform X2 [Odontomachus brunneus]
MEVNDFLETNISKPLVVKVNKQPSDAKAQSQVFMLHSYNSVTAGRNLVPKYRPIRPKPCVGGDKISKSKNKFVEISPTLSLPVQTRNRVVTNGNAGDVYDKHGIHGTHGTHDKKGIHETHNKKRIPKKNKSRATIELFFDSMAQSVSKLPAEVQAEIKMEICKLVTRAEIKHYGSQPK